MKIGRALIFCLWPMPGAAVTLDLPVSASPTAKEVHELGSYPVPTGPFRDGEVAVRDVEGKITETAWKLRASGATTLQLLRPLRQQLQDAGFEVIFECDAESCGGFDFRYEVKVLQEPEMHVDIGDYRFLSARRQIDGDQEEFATLIASRSATAGFVQITTIVPSGFEPEAGLQTTTGRTVVAGRSGSLADRLAERGRSVLDDLTFETGSSRLGQDSFASLADLAEFLKEDTSRRVTLVGHTDTEGALEANVALSERRAQSVADRLIETYGIDRQQISAAGVGFLSPRASNETESGRMENRRVEVILTPTQ